MKKWKVLVVVLVVVALASVVSSAVAIAQSGGDTINAAVNKWTGSVRILDSPSSRIYSWEYPLSWNQGGGLEQQIAELQATVAQQAQAIAALTDQLASTGTALDGRLDTIETSAAMQISPYIQLDTNAIRGVAGPNIVFTGVNLHLRSGSGYTAGSSGTPSVNGLGNLIIGYDEQSSSPEEVRTGSHNLVVGPEHSWTSYGGLLAGLNNQVLAPYASVSGGQNNTAKANNSSVSGGGGNTAGGANAWTSRDASVSGGHGLVEEDFCGWIAVHP